MNTIINVLASPSEAFASIKETPKFLSALLLLMAGAGLAQFFYFNGVDIAWFFEQQLAANPDTTEARAAQFVRLITSLSQPTVAAVFALISAIAIACVFLILALYFKLVSAITKDGLGYKQLFALVCWSSLPGVLSSLAQIVKLVTTDVSLMPATEINPLAFWTILGLDPIGAGTFDQVVMSMDPTNIWSLVLLILGYKIFSGKNIGTAAFIALIPTVVIFGLAFAW